MPAPRLRNYIDGEWIEAQTDEYAEVINPARCIAKITTHPCIFGWFPEMTGGNFVWNGGLTRCLTASYAPFSMF